MRQSQYLVQSDETFLDHLGNQVRLVLQSSSGQVYVLSAAILDAMLRAPEALSPVVQDELTTAGLLVADARDEFSEVVEENRAYLAAIRERKFVLMPAAYCNMGCGYCGQNHVRLPGRQHRDAVRQRLLLAAAEPSTSGINVSWFGAEPMMGYAQILDLSSSILPACETANIPYTANMVTNGSLLTLDKIRRLYWDAKVTSFEVTLDGAAERHNAQRPLKSGRGSFEHIVSTIAAACADDLPDLHFTIRTNVSRANQNEHREFAAAVRDGGIVHSRVDFYTALVREWGNDVSDFAVAPEDIIDIERNWLDTYAEYGLNTSELAVGRKYKVCVAVDKHAEVISPTGEVHTCTEQPLVPSRQHSQVGHVSDLQTPAFRPRGTFDDWNESLLGDTDAYCPTCAVFPICGGGCPLVWHEGTPACPSIKKTLPMQLSRYGRTLGLRTAVEHAAGPLG